MKNVAWLIFGIAMIVALITVNGATRVVLVTDPNGRPIEGAEVLGIAASTNGPTTTTNAEGRADIPRNAQGTQWVVVSKEGYETSPQIAVGETRPLRVTLVPEPVEETKQN